MACAPDGCGCGHEHDGHQHGGHDDASQQNLSHGTGCCARSAVNDDSDNPKVAEKA